MAEVQCFAYAEDVLSCAVMNKLVDYCNSNGRDVPLSFYPGFPENKRGCGNLKNLIPAVCNMAKANLRTFILTDLDLAECAPSLIRQWFSVEAMQTEVSDNLLFRVAEKEIEAWLLADRKGLSAFLDISIVNFPENPDMERDPKQCLLNIIRSKGRRRIHKDMLPRKNAHLGPEYNAQLCRFVQDNWNVGCAKEKSESLARAVAAICRF
ncbi:MAG: hypothetical protein JXR40_06795 [Pontiellaceae bacterium]|nr:hypothetical protein [Pontiellaceae bacterium]